MLFDCVFWSIWRTRIIKPAKRSAHNRTNTNRAIRKMGFLNQGYPRFSLKEINDWIFFRQNYFEKLQSPSVIISFVKYPDQKKCACMFQKKVSGIVMNKLLFIYFHFSCISRVKLFIHAISRFRMPRYIIRIPPRFHHSLIACIQ